MVLKGTEELWAWTRFMIALIPSRDGSLLAPESLEEFLTPRDLNILFKAILLNLDGNGINISF